MAPAVIILFSHMGCFLKWGRFSCDNFLISEPSPNDNFLISEPSPNDNFLISEPSPNDNFLISEPSPYEKS